MPLPSSAPRVGLARLNAGASPVLLGIAAVSAVLIAGGLILGGSRPTWWRQTAADEQRRALAGQIENGAWTVVTEIRPMAAGGVGGSKLSEPWSVSLTADAATAWLNEKLPRWLLAQENPARLPEGSELQAAFEDGAIRLGMCTGGGGGSGGGAYLTLTLRPRIDEHGLWLPATDASFGRLTVPASALFADDGEGAGQRFSPAVASLLRGRTPAVPSAVVKLPDGRRVRLLALEPRGDRLVITMRTEAGGGAGEAEGPLTAGAAPAPAPGTPQRQAVAAPEGPHAR